MLAVVAIAYVIATGAVYGLVQGRRDHGQRAVDRDPDRADVRRGHGLLPADRVALPRRTAARRRRRGGDGRAAARTGPAIFASGGIVVAAMLVLSLADFNATREMGPLLALGIVVMMACGLTLLPALLAAFGRRAFWPAIPRESRARRGGRPGLDARSGASCAAGRVAARRRSRSPCSPPARSATSAAAATSTSSEQYRDPPESVQGQELIRERFDPPGRVAPVDVLVADSERRARGQGRARARRRAWPRPTPTPTRRRLRLARGAARRSIRSRRRRWT